MAETVPVDLKPQSGRFGTFVVLLLFTVVWNGVVVHLVQRAAGFGDGRPERPLFLFAALFGIAGAVLLVLTVYQFLALFNPRPYVQLEHGTPRLGDRLRLRWRFRGNVARLRELTITLEGEEAATYRRGTRAVTDTHVFRRVELFRESSGEAMRRGVVWVELPVDSMHSFRSLHNAVKWLIRFKGAVPRWPDLKEEFVFEVGPAPEEMASAPVGAREENCRG